MVSMNLTEQDASSTKGMLQGYVVPVAILVAILMPIVSGVVYPTYMHRMPVLSLEFSRLIEAPFLLAELGVVIWAYRVGLDRGKIWQALPRDVQWATGALIAGLTISSIFISRSTSASMTHSLMYVLHLFFAMSVYSLARHYGVDSIRKVLPVFGIGLVTLAIFTAVRFSFPPPAEKVFGGVIEWESALPGFINVRHFGAWTGAIAAGFAIKILFVDEARKLGWSHFFYCLAAGMTVWSGTRAALLGMVVVLLVTIISLRRFPDIRNIGIAFLLTAFAMGVAFLLLPPDPAFYLFNLNDTASANSLTSGRLKLWEQTYDRWLASPLFGWGSGSTFWEVDIGWSHTQPHNVVLQYLISWGILGAAGGLWLVGRMIKAVHRPAIAEPVLLPLLAIMYCLLFQSLLEGMLHYPRYIMAIIMLGGLILVASRENVKDEAWGRRA
ncbi:O-antigen ligase family protein [Parerythrobacter jejuensis]|uniref:O-antigen ligase-related domain-containing protein n=1 Tax=Parerythrobacter jejuensis TaxID=795812 RepID=A0A845AYD0_9SPHN|nr:O-antigen ligase family protein [Parerythrobacter jejuensis]MXP31768.1 hypothetical protein [Parerythrobacter jejuensis]